MEDSRLGKTKKASAPRGAEAGSERNSRSPPKFVTSRLHFRVCRRRWGFGVPNAVKRWGSLRDAARRTRTPLSLGSFGVPDTETVTSSPLLSMRQASASKTLSWLLNPAFPPPSLPKVYDKKREMQKDECEVRSQRRSAESPLLASNWKLDTLHSLFKPPPPSPCFAANRGTRRGPALACAPPPAQRPGRGPPSRAGPQAAGGRTAWRCGIRTACERRR